MKLLIAVLLLASCTTTPPLPEAPPVASATPSVEFTRSIVTTFCPRKNKCEKPVTHGEQTVTLKLEPYHKGDSGLTGEDKIEIIDRQVPIKTEIRVIKKTGSDDFYVYMLIRSGAGSSREGKVKTVSVKSLAELVNVTVDDKPVEVKGGTLKPQLVFTGKP